MIGARAVTGVFAAALAAVALLTAACDKNGGTGGVVPAKAPAKLGPKRRYVFELEGDASRRPHTEKLFMRIEARGAHGPWFGIALDAQGKFGVDAHEGADWELLSEDTPSDAEKSYFWMIDARGTFGSETDVTVPTPQRTTVVVSAPSDVAGREWLSFHRPDGKSYGTVLNDLHLGLFERAYVPGLPHEVYVRRAAGRPFHFDGFAAGRYQIAVRVDDRQWLTREVTLEPGGKLELDAWGQPPGGGKVIVEEGSTILLIDGRFPVAPPRSRADIVFRETWEGVPPGTHKVRYVDGEEVEIEVHDGETTKVPKRKR